MMAGLSRYFWGGGWGGDGVPALLIGSEKSTHIGS